MGALTCFAQSALNRPCLPTVTAVTVSKCSKPCCRVAFALGSGSKDQCLDGWICIVAAGWVLKVGDMFLENLFFWA